MEELRGILLEHCRRYPELQLSDLVKLIYQNEFAGGHLISNADESLARLRAEYASVRRSELLCEGIGNGLCRLYLGGLDEINLPTVNQMFVTTANQVRGDIQQFEKKLSKLLACCSDGVLPFAVSDVERYLAEHKAQGYKPVSHSANYRQHYQPAYRIVKKEFCTYLPLLRRIDQLLVGDGMITVAIDGMSGAGKSSLGSLLATIYDCNLFHTDDYFLRQEQRTPERFAEPGGNIDYERLASEIISGLASGEPFGYSKFDCSQMVLGESVRVVPKRLNIVEGVYSQHPRFAHLYQLKVFMSIDPETQSQRILERNGAFMHQRFMNEWIPMENRYFNAMQIREQSDLVFTT